MIAAPGPAWFPYLAGTVDSDGSLTISRAQRKGPDGAPLGSPYYDPRITVSQTDRDAVDLFAQLFGGTVREYDYKPRPHARPLFTWCAPVTAQLLVLDAIEPWLLIKRQQADVLRRWLGLNAGRRAPRVACRDDAGRWASWAVDPAYVAARDALYAEMSTLNGARNRRRWAHDGSDLTETPKGPHA